MSLIVNFSHRGPDAYVVSPVGSLNSNTSPQFEVKLEEVLTKAPRVLVFDLHGLEYISSAGIRIFLKAERRMKNAKGSLTYMNLQPQIRKVFDIINAIPSMQVFASLEELDDYLDKMQRWTE